MLLVSASMLSTASYAWFSMNNKVTASGMKVNVVTPGNLEISNTKTFVDGTTSVDISDQTGFADVAKALAPVSSVNGAIDGFYIADPKTVTNTTDDNWSAGTATKISAVSGVDVTVLYGTKAYAYVDYSFYVRTTSTTDKKVYINAETKFEAIDTASTALLPAFRFAVLIDDTPTLVNNSVWCGATNAALTTENEKAWIKEKDAGVAITEATDLAKINQYNGSDIIATIKGTENANYTADYAQKITVRIWIEGQDPACKLANIATELKDYKLTISLATND